MVQNNKMYEHTTPLNEKSFKSFLQDEMIVKEAKAFKDLVDKRFSYIVHKIAEINAKNVKWFDYDNESGGEGVGYFDTDSYKESVSYTGDVEFLSYKPTVKNTFDKYDNNFPTKWFYTNFELDLKKEQEDFLQKEKNKQEKVKLGKEKIKEDFEKVKNSIRKKLTLEEMAYIRFITIEEVNKNQVKHNQSVANEASKFIKDFTKEMKQQGIDVSKMYQHYRIGKKKPKNFYDWVIKNHQEIKKSKKEETMTVGWPFPIRSNN